MMASPGAVGPVDVRGGAPGTRETDLLDPVNLIERVDVARVGLSLNWCKMVLYPHPRFQSTIELFDENDHELAERTARASTREGDQRQKQASKRYSERRATSPSPSAWTTNPTSSVSATATTRHVTVYTSTAPQRVRNSNT